MKHKKINIGIIGFGNIGSYFYRILEKNKIVILIGNKLWNWNTVLTFKESNLNVVGVCIYENRILGIPFKFIFRSIKKRGLITVIDQILGRIFYKILNFRSDKKKLKKFLT